MKTEILVYPNITYAKNLEADSYVVVIGEIIRRFAVTRPDFHFTMLLPERVESLALSNVTQVEYPLPTYPNTMRAHFDTHRFLWAIDWKNRSYDVVWSHLPEHTAQVKNVFYNATNERPAFVGYSHWVEIPANTTYPETLFLANVAGMLAQDVVGVNSEWVKRKILAEARRYFSDRAVDTLDEIMVAQYLGCDVDPVDVQPEPGLLVWNHRLHAYTGFDDALRALDALWERRQDFRVMFTLGDVDRPYAEPVRIDAADYRRNYLRTLARASYGLGRAGYAPWSVAVMDGLNLGVPYVLPIDSCYPEVLDRSGYPLFYNDLHQGALAAVIEEALDTPPLRENLSPLVRAAGERFSWANRVGVFEETLDRAVASLTPLSRATPKYEDVKRLHLQGASKAEITKAMGWGRGIPYAPYRNRLRAEGVL
jgi:glycosyltransferase involved in cell wall biosynthesis